MKVPQMEPWVGQEEYKAIASCFKENWITEGPKTKEFQEKLLKLIGAKYGVFAPNGTLALYLGLRALNIGQDDEVIVPDFTFIASATSVEMTGARPVFVDVNKKNFQIDLRGAEKLINKHTRAIMPVHIYGTVADMDSVMKFAKKHKLKVIEDAAEAIGVHRNGVHAGTFGDVGTFSFFADKTITTAEGGFVVTNNQKIYEKLLYLRNQGRKDRGTFIHPETGYNFRLTDVHSAIGLVQLSKLKKIIRRKKHILSLYKKLLKDLPEVTFFEPDEGVEWIPFRMGILVENAHELMSFLEEHSVAPRTFFYPLHKQPAFSYLNKIRSNNNKDDNFPNAIYGYEHGVCLPAFPTLTDEQIIYVCKTIKDFYHQKINLFYQYYDILFRNKDYEGETRLIFKLLEKYGKSDSQRILEIGCGTGNHTLSLAKKGFKKLIAIDIDSRMVDIAKKKLKKKSNVQVLHTSVEELDKEGFDLILGMFNVVTYISSSRELKDFMENVSKRLVPGGIFIFDCWNGVAAIQFPPGSKKTLLKHKGEKISCLLTSKTDLLNQKTTLNYKIKVTKNRDVKQGDFSFIQTLWTPMQIKSVVEQAGMEVVLCSPLMQADKVATHKDWKIMFCCRKRN